MSHTCGRSQPRYLLGCDHFDRADWRAPGLRSDRAGWREFHCPGYLRPQYLVRAKPGLQRRHAPPAQCRHLQPGDEPRPAGAAPAGDGYADRHASAAHRPPQRDRPAKRDGIDGPAGGGADLHRGYARPEHHGGAQQGAAAPIAGRRRPDHHRLLAADGRQAQRQPRAGGQRDLARAQGAGARAERAGDRAVAALARGGGAARATCRCCPI